MKPSDIPALHTQQRRRPFQWKWPDFHEAFRDLNGSLYVLRSLPKDPYRAELQEWFILKLTVLRMANAIRRGGSLADVTLPLTRFDQRDLPRDKALKSGAFSVLHGTRTAPEVRIAILGELHQVLPENLDSRWPGRLRWLDAADRTIRFCQPRYRRSTEYGRRELLLFCLDILCIARACAEGKLARPADWPFPISDPGRIQKGERWRLLEYASAHKCGIPRDVIIDALEYFEMPVPIKPSARVQP